MAIHGYPGGIISATAPTTSPTSASGVWTLDDQLQAGANWPVAPSFVSNSVRLRSSASAYLNRTPASSGNRQIFTWSGWVKRGSLSAFGQVLTAGASSTTNGYSTLGLNSNGSAYIVFYSTESHVYESTALYRDPSSWYHIVFSVDTTQSTASNRVKMYVNGVQTTLSVTSGYTAVPQNFNTAVNSTVSHLIGALRNSAGSITEYFDGYLADVNFIDGQALTPNYFGAIDAATGVWQPATYRGSYGTNGFYLPFNTITEYPVNNFSGASNIYWTAPNGAMAVGTGNFTCEFFFYATAAGNNVIGSGQSGTNFFVVATSANGVVDLYMTASGGGSPISSASGAWKLNQWNYVNINRSGGNVTVNVNGIAGSATSNTTNLTNASFPLVLGGYTFTDAGRWAGQISNFRFSNTVRSIAVPSAPLTSDANTLFLTAQSNSFVDNGPNAFTITNSGVTITTAAPLSSTISTDQSGNGNNWTAINISLSNNTTYDSMTDVPTLTSATQANFAVMNPLVRSTNNSGSISQSDGNLSTSIVSFANAALGTIGVTSGKFYWEFTPTSGGNFWLGVAGVGYNRSAQPDADPLQWAYYAPNGNKANNSYTSYGSSYTTGDVIGIALDMDNGTLTFYKNNTSQGTAFTNLAGNTIFPMINSGNTGTHVTVANFGQRPFAYTPPTGFVALNTFNLPTPTIGATASTQAGKYFNPVLYTGNGGTQSITGVGFQPDFTWVKRRDTTSNHLLTDAVRGAGRIVSSNLTNAEVDDSAFFTSFNADGFSMAGGAGSFNASGGTYVAWNWNAGGSTVTNTSGSITSQVRANTTSGFSIVTYTGTGSAATVGHGLGVAPSWVICKRRNAIAGWPIFVRSLNNNAQYMTLNNGDGANTDSTVFNNTAPTSTVFSLGTDTFANANGGTYVAYCFAPVAGYSAFGSYTGNGSNDGVFIYTGFRPRYLLVKRTNSSGTFWNIYDTARMPFNVADDVLFANLTDAELANESTLAFDILSNGFKARTSGTSINGSGLSYIYAAFAESPFKYANAR